GSDSNGGGYVSGGGGTDYSQQNGAQVVVNNSTIVATSATTTITFVSGYTPSAADVGNVYQDTGANGSSAGVYQITAQTPTTWTLDRSIGTSTGLVGRMGGALATLGKSSGAYVGGNTIWATGSETITSGVTFATTGAPSTPVLIQGYGSARGDFGR